MVEFDWDREADHMRSRLLDLISEAEDIVADSASQIERSTYEQLTKKLRELRRILNTRSAREAFDSHRLTLEKAWQLVDMLDQCLENLGSERPSHSLSEDSAHSLYQCLQEIDQYVREGERIEEDE